MWILMRPTKQTLKQVDLLVYKLIDLTLRNKITARSLILDILKEVIRKLQYTECSLNKRNNNRVIFHATVIVTILRN